MLNNYFYLFLNWIRYLYTEKGKCIDSLHMVMKIYNGKY